jgi:hypothetical protein
VKIRKSLAVLGASAAIALGAGGAMAPSASAHTGWDDARYMQTDLRGNGTQNGPAAEDFGGAGSHTPPSGRSLRCWDTYVSGRVFGVSCSGVRYWVYADCSNGSRYIVGPLRGSKRESITCPGYSRVVRGGSYGY